MSSQNKQRHKKGGEILSDNSNQQNMNGGKDTQDFNQYATTTPSTPRPSTTSVSSQSSVKKP